MAKKEKQLDPEVEKQLPGQFAQAIKDGRVPESILKHSHDADEALLAYQGYEGRIFEIDEATSKRICRRIDWNIMPVSNARCCHFSTKKAKFALRSCV